MNRHIFERHKEQPELRHFHKMMEALEAHTRLELSNAVDLVPLFLAIDRRNPKKQRTS
jgi:hypothetical protein